MRRLSVAALSIGSSFLFACGAPDRGDDGGGDDGGGDDEPIENCSDAAKQVYTIDSTNNHLLEWDGATKTFNDLGVLNCPLQSDPIFGIDPSPFSMSVDRNAVAWILYSDSSMMRVDTVNGLACSDASYTVQQSMLAFGMGFSTDAAGGTTDKLFIAGGSSVGSGSSTLATLDTSTMQVTRVGTVQGDPELTGTGTAELWGFFPDTINSRIARLNKTTGAAEETFAFTQANGQPMAWAFAYWGGDFWVFLQKDTDASTSVYQVDGESGTLVSTTPAPGKSIVGAGVSTCAPNVIL